MLFFVQTRSVGSQNRCMWSDAMHLMRCGDAIRCIWSDAVLCTNKISRFTNRCMWSDAMHLMRSDAIRSDAYGPMLFFFVHTRSVGLQTDACGSMRCGPMRSDACGSMLFFFVQTRSAMWETTFPRNSHAGLGKDCTKMRAYSHVCSVRKLASSILRGYFAEMLFPTWKISRFTNRSMWSDAMRSGSMWSDAMYMMRCVHIVRRDTHYTS